MKINVTLEDTQVRQAFNRLLKAGMGLNWRDVFPGLRVMESEVLRVNERDAE